jgi:hypothetical protein
MPKNMGPYLPVPSFQIGPISGEPETSPNTWEKTFVTEPSTSPGGTRFVILHFTGALLPADNRLEVELGYDMDVFTNLSGSEFWTRPINVDEVMSVTLRYIVDGSASGGATLTGYGRGESGIYGEPSNPDYYNQTNPDLFLKDDVYDEPFYETRGLCGEINWENVACLIDGSLEKDVALRTCITIMIKPVSGSEDLKVNCCSGTLIDNDLVLTAAHCFPSSDSVEVASGSVTFDFQTTCEGGRPSGYAPRFFKIKRMERCGWERTEGDTRGTLDYSILKIETPPTGLDFGPLGMRPDLPAIGEDALVGHHPQGVVKKMGNRHTDPRGSVAVIESYSSEGGHAIGFGVDLTSGSSGSGLIDAAGNVMGVNIWSGHCENKALASSSILNDITTDPPPPRARDVFLVFDRSGSMSMPGSVPGVTKMEEARSAAALFLQLIRSDAGDRAGLVSFSTAPVLDYDLHDVNAGSKSDLIGGPPYISGLVGGLAPGGTTSIGGGLRTAQQRLPDPLPENNVPNILLLTDGLQNTPPMIEEVVHELGATQLSIIGFGTEASLNGHLLTRLARDHGGNYTRAGSGLELQKFFVLSFGNIFESGTSMDPDYFLGAEQDEAKPVPLLVCGEDSLTVAVGWDRFEANLKLELETPGGSRVSAEAPGVVSVTGRSWTFIRLSLPIDGERDGQWKIHVSRTTYPGVEFPPPPTDVHYFISTVIKGGAWLRPIIEQKTVYTGDTINPRVILRERSGNIPRKATIKVTVTAPAEGTGNLLTESGLQTAVNIDGDQVDVRTSTLLAMEQTSTQPLIPTIRQTFTLYDDGLHDDGAMDSDGIFGNPLEDLTRFEGNYTFHAQASFGLDCTTVREASWSMYVGLGIDHDNTTINTEDAGSLPDGRRRLQVLITPRDRYGNHLGPGRTETLQVDCQQGGEFLGPIRDMGEGTYLVDMAWPADANIPPGLIVSQPGRRPFAVCDVTSGGSEEKPCRYLKLLLIFSLTLSLVLLVLLIILLSQQ